MDYIHFSLQHDLGILQDWFLANKLTLNISKSVCILFGKHQNQVLDIKIGHESIPQVGSTKFLGLWIDQDLSWKEHISAKVKAKKSKLNLLLTSKNFLSTHALRILYFAQINSNLTYGISMWGSLLMKTNLTKLQKIQDTCMKILCHGKGPLEAVYTTNKVLTVSQQIEFELCKLWHKKQLDILPAKLSSVMSSDHFEQLLQKLHRYPTRQKNLSNRPKSTYREYHDSFLVKGNRIYSHLNQEIRTCNSLKRFTVQLQKHLLDKKNSIHTLEVYPTSIEPLDTW